MEGVCRGRIWLSVIAVVGLLLLGTTVAFGTCTTGWFEPNDDDTHAGGSWDNGYGGRYFDDDAWAHTDLNGDEHEYDDYAFTYADIPSTAVIVGFEVRIRGYGLNGPASVSVALSEDGGSTIDLEPGTTPWVISLPSGSSNEAWNSVSIENPPYGHTFIPEEVCGGNDRFTVWVKANTGLAGTIYVDSVQVRVTYYDEVGSVWPDNPTPSSSTHAIDTWYNASTLPSPTVTINWTSANDNPACDSGIDEYRVYWDNSPSTSLGAGDGYKYDEDDPHTEGFPLGYNEYWFHIRSIDNAKNPALTTEHYGPFQYDPHWPSNPVVTSSKSTGWSNTATVPIAASGASDGLSGVDGFAFAWDHSGAWMSDEAKDREEGWTGETFTMAADGVWYFHLITVDNAGNWAAAGTDIETVGWFGVDTHAPNDPAISSPTHAEGSLSNEPDVQIAVSGASDTAYGESGYEARSGVDGFSVVWDHNATGVPDATKDQEENWTGATTTLADGTWYYHLRTVDNAGNWTSTGDYGPITIDTLNPTVTVDIVDGALNDGDNRSNVTFEFSEDVTGFAVGDVTPSNGAVSSFVVTDASHYSVTFTATDGVDGTGSVSVGAGTYTDLAGNSGAAGSDTVAIDTLNPAITSIVRQNPATENTEITPVTFRVTFTEDVANVDTTDFSLSGTATAAVDSVAMGGSDAVYDVGVAISTGCGELDLDIGSGNNIEDLVGNDLGDTPSIGTEETYAVQAPDIEVTADSLQAVASDDGEISVQGTITLANGGSGSSLTTDVPVRFTLYDETGCAGDVIDQWSETLTGVNIPSGGGTQVFPITPHGITTNLCENSTGCEVSVHIEADFTDAIRECDETDNTYCSDKPVSIPNIEVSGDALGITATNDGEVSVSGTITLTNDGCGSNLTTNVPVQFTLYDETGCGGGMVHQWSETLTGVNIPSGGGSQVVPITLHGITTNLCENSTGCEVSVHVEADFTHTIAECDGTDNTYCSDKTVSIPDIEVSADTLTVTCTRTGVDVDGSVTLRNGGCTATLTSDVPVRLTLYGASGCGGPLQMISQWTETLTGVNIAAGGTQALDITQMQIACSLCGCQDVSIRIEADYSNAIAECDGSNNARCTNRTVIDVEDPEIHDLRLDQHVLVDDCCEATIAFDGYVDDNCCVDEDDITFTVSNPTGNATVTLSRADIVFTDTGKYRVDFAGEIHVRCLTSCPAYAVLEVNATDACGNSAATVWSEPNPASVLPPYTGGDVYDETQPVPLNDPRQDVYEAHRTDLEVRLCEDELFRLMVREDTPVYIHPLYNDNDNCSDCTCCGSLWLYDIVRQPEYGTANVVTDVGDCNGGIVIRYAPQQGYIGDDWFTYRIVDACENISGEATIRVQMVRETMVEDVSVIACSGEPTAFVISATDLFVDPEDPDEIPFTFDLVSGPLHGVLLGDLDDIFYTAASRAIGPTGELVPTLDFVESANVYLTYTSADDYVGRDRVTFRLADPFANASEGVVDILVEDCAGSSGLLLAFERGTSLVLILPETFEEVVAGAWATVTVFSIPEGVSYAGTLRAVWSDALGRHVLMLDTAEIPVGEYRLVVPLGSGQAVTVAFEVGEAE